jgi:4'-phosphopantetheinyl transferase EntD
MKLAARLFEAPVRTSEIDPRGVVDGLLPEEEPAIARAVAKRRHEFVAGRVCAREAMHALGLPPAAIVPGPDRAPIWPESVIGTITHTDTWCAAAIARAGEGVRALGLDVEPDTPLRPTLVRPITIPEERAWLDAQPEAERGLLGKLVFSAKECAYKAQYPLTRCFFGFSGMRIHLDVAGGTFVAVFEREAGEFGVGDELRGKLVVDHGYVMTGMTIGG